MTPLAVIISCTILNIICLAAVVLLAKALRRRGDD